MNLKAKNLVTLTLICLVAAIFYQFSNLMQYLDFDELNGRSINLPLENLTFYDHSGNSFNTRELKGKYSLLSFGFTLCSGTCPININRFQKVSALLQDTNIRLNYVFISFDKLRDTKEQIIEYKSSLNFEELIILRSNNKEADQLANSLFETININKKAMQDNKNYQINHNGFLYLINPEGTISVLYNRNDVTEKQIVSDILKLEKISQR